MQHLIPILFLVVLSNAKLISQEILLERGLVVAGLHCYPVYQDTLSYRYLPATAQLGTMADSLPTFSFFRYVGEMSADGATALTGGGLLHFLATYSTSEEQLRVAQQQLRKRFNNQKVKIIGPVSLGAAHYQLISSSALEKMKVIASGAAPILEGSKIAISMSLNEKQSNLLLESFKMSKADISLVFDLSFSGLTERQAASLLIDWARVQEVLGKAPPTSTLQEEDRLQFVNTLFVENAVRWHDLDFQEVSASLSMAVIDKLSRILFAPQGLAKRAGRLKQLPFDGQTRIYFQGADRISRHFQCTVDFSDMFERYGTDQRVFKDVLLFDPSFQQRRVYIGVDNSFNPNLSSIVLSADIALRKTHRNGKVTLKEILLTDFPPKNRQSFTYLNRQDTILEEWLYYDYRTEWRFRGGGEYRTNWTTANASMINLSLPVEERELFFEGNLDKLKDRGVRAIVVKLKYSLSEVPKQEKVLIRLSEYLLKKSCKVMLSLNHKPVDYEITWLLTDGRKWIGKGQEELGMIFIDRFPDS